jgi:ABC-type antimicrobial peptide transport system permease subunit
MIDYAWRNLLRRKSRTLLTVVGICVLTALVTVISGIVAYNKKTMNQHAAAGVGRIVVQTFLAGSEYPTRAVDLPDALSERILNLPQIQRAISSRAVFYPLAPSPYPNEPPALLLVGVTPGHESAFTGNMQNRTKAIEGSGRLSVENVARPCLLGDGARARLQEMTGRVVAVGDAVPFLENNCTVVGLLEKSKDRVVNNALVVPLSLAQQALGKESLVSSVLLYPKALGTQTAILETLKEMDAKLKFVTEETIARNATDGIKQFEALIDGVGVVIVLGTTILLTTVILMIIRERQKEIGVMRAIGAGSGLIARIFFMEALMLSLLGSVIGGVIAGFILRFSFPENLFDALLLAKFLPMGVVIAVVASVMPAIKISRLLPIESLRAE